MTGSKSNFAIRLLLLTAIVPLFLSFTVSVGAQKGKPMEASQTTARHTNHLVDENSPYLLSHAHNPVDWYPWNEEALQRARQEGKPIFLSIGYAACHWCHVMERESFENEEIATILNENFISIKVDREQRPDLDHIYMAFTTAMTGGGGWPMSVFLTSDLKPFFAGTYFPPDDGYGRPGFKRLITELARAYTEEKDRVINAAGKITDQMTQRLQATAGQDLLVEAMIQDGASQLMRGFDHTNGGFGSAPKFPHATELSLFLRHYNRSGDSSYRDAALKALNAMARGGINDQIGGGFARYSTDDKWLVPHFEKMLYDNGLLVPLYVEAYQITGDTTYLGTVRETLDFILNEMADDNGGFYSSLDADSEGEEGKFYVWSKSEIDEILGDDAEWFNRYYGVTQGGNFEGHNILNLSSESDRIRQNWIDGDFESRLKSARARLFEARSKRIRPGTDDKILSSWNGLALHAFCKGYQVTGDRRYLDAAIANAEFVNRELFRDNRLTHSYREGKHSSGQFLEDYGYYLHGLLELYQSDPSSDNSQWLDFAEALANNAIDLFMDESGTLYLRDDNQPDLIVRPKDESDGALPSPGSLLIGSLMKLSRLTGDNKYSEAAAKGLRAVSGLMATQPSSTASALLALDYYLSDKSEVVIVGNSRERSRMLDKLRSRYSPNTLVAMSDNGTSNSPLFEGRKASDGETVAFVCVNSACRLPVTSAEDLSEQLAEAIK